MTMPQLPPLPGTPIHGLGAIAHMAGQTAEHVRAALSPSTGRGMHSTASGNAVTFSQDATPAFACFEIVACWQRTKAKHKVGATVGVSWVCDAMPVAYWRDWSKVDAASAEYPDLFWKAFDNKKPYGPTQIWWSIEGPPHEPPADNPPVQCTQPSASGSGSTLSGVGGSVAGSLATPAASLDGSGQASAVGSGGSGSSGSPKKPDDWQAALYPLYGIGQWVWCIFDRAASVWRVLQPYDDLIRFRLITPLKGCGKAKAHVLGYPCKAPKKPKTSSSSGSSGLSGSSQTSASSTSPSSGSSSAGSSSKTSSSAGGSSHQPSSAVPSAGSGCQGGSIHVMRPHASGSGPTGSLDGSVQAPTGEQSCLRKAFSRGVTVVHDPQGIVYTTFPDTRKAPAGATGWAKRCADSGCFEVIAYGKCRPRFAPASSSGSFSSSEPASSSAQSSSAGSSYQPSSSFKPSSAAKSSAGSSESSASSSVVSSSGGSSVPSSAPSGSGGTSSRTPSGASKSTAIVPASWKETGYAALFVEENPEVSFTDRMIVAVTMPDSFAYIDPKYIEVCEPGSLECIATPDVPVLVGAVVEGTDVHLRVPVASPENPVRLVIRLSGIRKGFFGVRLPDRTAAQFEANERFINSAYER